jgi:Putative auto-transporter adhesin, head GIN domain
MSTDRLLAAAILAGTFAAACEPQPEVSTVAPQGDQIARMDNAPMSVTEVSLTGNTNIPVTGFDSVELRGGGHVTLRYGNSDRVTLLAGSTQFTQFHLERGHNLVIDACNSQCPSQYHLEIEIVMPHLAAVAIDGGGHIESSPGFPAQGAITAAVNGGGNIDLRSIAAANGTAAVSGGGRIHIHVDQHLTAAVNGGGSIGYLGAADVTTAVNGGGSVRREDGGRG